MKHANIHRADARVPDMAPEAVIPATNGQPNAPAQRSQESRNKANTIKNVAKVEQFLMEVEKAHGCARSWDLRERLEQGHVCLADLMGR